MMEMSAAVKATIKDAAQKLTGHRRGAFMAKVAEDYFEGSARQTETYLGWNRDNVQLGLHERRSQILCADNYQARGRHKSEALLPQLEADVRALVDVLFPCRPEVLNHFFICPD